MMGLYTNSTVSVVVVVSSSSSSSSSSSIRLHVDHLPPNMLGGS